MRSPTILVTVGSDHPPFDRLIGWMDDWLARSGIGVTCVMQFGTAQAPRSGEAHDYLPHDALQRLLVGADTVVTQGGPMGIVESRRCGTKPIAVPRRQDLGEVVDDHQRAFCRKLADAGELVLAETSTELWNALDLALANPDVYRIEADKEQERVLETATRFAVLAGSLPPRRRLFSRERPINGAGPQRSST